MKILIIEDDDNKRATISHVLTQTQERHEIVERRSYQSGLKAIFSDQFDLCILDMSLPTFDISPDESGYQFRHFGGQDAMREIARKKISTKILVVTQFEAFGESGTAVSLTTLDRALRAEFREQYLGYIYYNPSESQWRRELEQRVRLIGATVESARSNS